MSEHDPHPLNEPAAERGAGPAKPADGTQQLPVRERSGSDQRRRRRSPDGRQGHAYPGAKGHAIGAPGAGPEPRHLLDYLLTLYRHRWTALSALAVVFVAVAVYTFTVTPEFEGRAQIQIDPDPNIVAFKQVSDLDKRSIEYFQTQLTILQSRALARKTIDGLNMWGDPEFVGERTGESKPAAADETAAQSLAIDTLLHRLSVEPIPDTRLVEVRVSSPTAAAAAKITNALVNTYIEQNLEQGSQSSRDATDWLSEQLALQRKKLEGSEQALQNYREQGNAIALDDRQNIVVQRLTDLNAAVTRARTDRLQKEAQYQQLARLQGNRAALETFPAIQSNGFIQSLKSQLSDLQRQRAQMSERLGENHPDMIKLATAIEAIEAKLQVEIEKSVESVRNQFLSAQAQERSLVGELERQKTDALALNRTGIEYDVLKREAASNKQIYETLMQRAKETGITRDLKSSNIRIVDLAEVPLRPVRPNKQVNLLLGLIVGALAGIGLAAFFEYLDNRIKNPDDIKRQLGLPFLGLVPTIQAKELQGTSPLLGSGVPVTFGEAMRGIRTNVQFSSAEEGSRSLVVTSSQPGEGKSVMASNLAVSFAQAGKRVLLVDADMRKPRQHDIFGVVSDPGLSNVIAGTAKAVDAVVKTPTQNLWLLPAGFIPPNPAELLGSARFAEILENLMAHFDWVVFDMPPVHAVTDASVIAHLMTGVVFVVGSEQTTRQSAQRAVEQLAGAQATILGAILNRVNVSSNPYYYAQQYRRAYGGYYTASGKRR